jgi:hypothetical protein
MALAQNVRNSQNSCDKEKDQREINDEWPEHPKNSVDAAFS